MQLNSCDVGLFHVCWLGDVMGCGILFPRDYRREFDASDPPEGDYLSDAARNDFVDLDGGFTESESEDEAWWEKPNAENGIKVQVGIYLPLI